LTGINARLENIDAESTKLREGDADKAQGLGMAQHYCACPQY
jgi:hypothetical protein